jgi:transposase
MYKSIVSNQRKDPKMHSTMRYIKRTKNKKIFKVEKMICSKNSFCGSVIGKTLKIIPNLNYHDECNKTYIIQYDSKKDQFLLLKRDPVTLSNYKTPYEVISIDPGVRTYLTGISENKIVEIGIDIKSKVTKVLNKIETYKKLNKEPIDNGFLSKKIHTNNLKVLSFIEKNNIELFNNETWNDTLNNLYKYESLNKESLKNYNRKVLYKEECLKSNKLSNNKTNRLINKQETYLSNYINDIQWKIADYLSANYNNVIIGNLSTRHMRKKNSSDLPILKILGMYKLREKIKYKCILRNRKYLRINESYTTKCCVTCAKENNIGKNKIYKCKFCNETYDRDIKAAGLIYLKALV